jgi:hypothetical protein
MEGSLSLSMQQTGLQYPICFPCAQSLALWQQHAIPDLWHS